MIVLRFVSHFWYVNFQCIFIGYDSVKVGCDCGLYIFWTSCNLSLVHFHTCFKLAYLVYCVVHLYFFLIKLTYECSHLDFEFLNSCFKRWCFFGCIRIGSDKRCDGSLCSNEKEFAHFLDNFGLCLIIDKKNWNELFKCLASSINRLK